MKGYLSSEYAQSLVEFGEPMQLPTCGGWLLGRPIAGSGLRDAMGCYPRFCCADWSRLNEDLESLGGEIVSVVLATDPFAAVGREQLEAAFPNRVCEFKSHFVVDYAHDALGTIDAHHRYYARRALRELDVEVCQAPAELLDDWMRIYGVLVERHRLRGIKAFSRVAFAAQLQTPGIFSIRASKNGQTVGIQLWFVGDDVAYSHLTAVDCDGYRLRANYALYGFALEALSAKVRWLDLGASAGLNRDNGDGLAVFKRGWSNATRTSYLCGRVFDPSAYQDLVATQATSTNYFPAYREGELL